MYKYMFNYVILIFIFLLTDIFINYTPAFFNILSYLPTITMLGNGTIFALIPYTYLIVKFLFIKKANEGDTTEYINIKKQIIRNVTIINIISTIIESILLNNTFIWIAYTFLITVFLMILKTKKENQSEIINKNINDYFNNKK